MTELTRQEMRGVLEAAGWRELWFGPGHLGLTLEQAYQAETTRRAGER